MSMRDGPALYANSDDEARRGFGLVRNEVARLDRKYSHFRADSVLAGLSRRAARPGGVNVDNETAALLDYAARQTRVSGGLFDITARRLTRLWDRADRLPSPEAIERELGSTGWHRVEWDGKRLSLPRGYELDLGGVVKEYAADRAAYLLKNNGFSSGYVDLGGDFHVLGPHPDGRSWHIGIRRPDKGDCAAAAVRVQEGGLASSGDYERFSEIDGVRYSHFVDPRTGWAMKGSSAGTAVSVLAPTCLLAGSVATLAMLFGPAESRKFLARSGLPWLALDRGGARYG
jgi:thiamine biosynthesis lipoprotein